MLSRTAETVKTANRATLHQGYPPQAHPALSDILTQIFQKYLSDDFSCIVTSFPRAKFV